MVAGFWCRAVCPWPPTRKTAKPVDIAIVVSLDCSESIDAEEAGAQIDGLVYTLRHSRLRDTVAVGWHGSIGLTVLNWSSFGRHEVVLPWKRIAGPAAFLQVSASNEDFANAMLRKILLETVRLRQPYVSAGRETG